MLRIVSFGVVLSFAVVLVGCGENPAENVAPAVTSAPKSVDPLDNKVGGNPVAAEPEAAPAPAAAATPAPTPAAAAAPAPAPAAATGLAISGASGSKIEFIGSKKVGGAHTGGFKAWTGAIEPSADGKGVAKISVDIDMTSIWSDDEKLTAHLKNQDFFEVDKFPKASFVTTEIKTGGEKGATHTLVGNLTLHGVTKSIQIPATVKLDGGVAALTSEFSLKRSEFGMTFTGPGGVIRDEVVIKLDVKSAAKAG
ncbi:MAG: YceI family protein [Isosphaeraceae bacterium]|nr:YceI family protein [Isosphaeraceae bacterium]